MKKLLCLFFLIAALIVFSVSSEQQPPYPQSELIKSVMFDWQTHKRLAPGSDNWPITWAADNNQYSAWGDGGGFGGTNREGRVSLGVARIDGEFPDYFGQNVWGGLKPESEKRFEKTGKSYGIISIDSVLYMWVAYDDKVKLMFDIQLYFSKDYGVTWEKASWIFPKGQRFMTPTFAQFGQDYSHPRDRFVYTYAVNVKDDSRLKIQVPGEIILLRVPRDQLLERDSYEAFAGFDKNGKPLWDVDISRRVPVFYDQNGVGWNCAVNYNAGLGRYILTTEHGRSFKGNLGIFEASEPWGPWKTVAYMRGFGRAHIQPSTFFWNFSNKWTSSDGRDFVLVFTGVRTNDAWNTIKGEFLLYD